MHSNLLLAIAGALPMVLSAPANDSPPGETYEGFYTGDIIPTPHCYSKGRGEILLARRDARAANACILLQDKPASAAKLAAEELQARVAHLLGPEAPRLPIVQSIQAAKGFRAVVSVDYVTMGDMMVPGDMPRPVPPDTYYVRPGNDDWVLCWGESAAGTYFAVQSLMQLTFERDGAAYLQRADIVDWPMFPLRSFKMGDQDWDLIREMARWCGHYRYNCYNVCYTTVGQDRWKDPSPEYRQLIADLCAFRVPRGLDVMPFVNPYYLWREHIVISDDAQIDALARTFGIALDAGARRCMLCLDDFASEKIPYVIRSEADRQRFGTLGEANAHLVNELHRRLKARFPDCTLLVVPPYYWIPAGNYGEQGEADLRTIGARIPNDVPIVWTGPVVRSAVIRKEDVDAYSALIGRRPFLWDNTLYMHHNPPSYFLDAFVTRYPDRFWEITDTGVHYNAGGGEVYKVGLMTTADYLWNPQAYEPERSLRRALHQATGSLDAVDACLALRDAYYRIYDSYKPVLDSLLKLQKEPEFPYRPFDAADLDAIEADLRAVTDAYARVKGTCRNARLTEELAEYAQRHEQYRDMIAWLREHQPSPGEARAELAVNGSAEEVDAAGRPGGWGRYQGAGPASIGTSEDEPAEGKRCAYLDAAQWYDLHGRDWLNVALMQGDSDGFTGPKAYVARPLTKYRVQFKLRGDAAKVRFAAVGWSRDAAGAGDRQALFCSLDELEPTPDWRAYEATFTTALDTKRFALKFGLEGYRDEGAKLGRICVDDVHILVGP